MTADKINHVKSYELGRKQPSPTNNKTSAVPNTKLSKTIVLQNKKTITTVDQKTKTGAILADEQLPPILTQKPQSGKAIEKSPKPSVTQKPKEQQKQTKTNPKTTTKKPLKKMTKKNKQIKIVPINIKTSLKSEREAAILKLVVKQKSSNGRICQFFLQYLKPIYYMAYLEWRKPLLLTLQT